jgi:hypothetical protein
MGQSGTRLTLLQRSFVLPFQSEEIAPVNWGIAAHESILVAVLQRQHPLAPKWRQDGRREKYLIMGSHWGRTLGNEDSSRRGDCEAPYSTRPFGENRVRLCRRCRAKYLR